MVPPCFVASHQTLNHNSTLHTYILEQKPNYPSSSLYLRDCANLSIALSRLPYKATNEFMFDQCLKLCISTKLIQRSTKFVSPTRARSQLKPKKLVTYISSHKQTVPHDFEPIASLLLFDVEQTNNTM